MAYIKFRIQLNKGKRGVPLKKFTSIGKKFGNFLISLGDDIGIRPDVGKWIVVNFDEKNSLAFDYEYTEKQTEDKVKHYNNSLKVITGFKADDAEKLSVFKRSTLKQYAELAKKIEDEEKIEFGFYDNDNKKPSHWENLTIDKSKILIELIEEKIECYGSVQGEITSFNKAENECYINIRELSSGKNISCYFNNQKYAKVLSLLKDRYGIVHVYGKMNINRVNNKIHRFDLDRIEPAEKYKDGDIDKFLGCSPNITGDLTTTEFITTIRRRKNKLQKSI